jgi:hypothetical protein
MRSLEYGKGWLEAFDQYLIEPGEFLDLGECVVVVGRVIARGHGSGVDAAATGVALSLSRRQGDRVSRVRNQATSP